MHMYVSTGEFVAIFARRNVSVYFYFSDLSLEAITCEVSLYDVGHLSEVAVAAEGDAGGHRQDVPDVSAEQGDVFLQERAHAQDLRVCQG